jgi:hypothetical protein
MACASQIYRRQSIYWFRQRIPAALKIDFFRKRLSRVSVRTSCLDEAKRRSARLRVLLGIFAETELAQMSGLQVTSGGFAAIVRQLVLAELDEAERVPAQRAARFLVDVQSSVDLENQQAT